MRRRHPRDDAFTIVELLVATSITVIIVVLLGGMFGSLISTSTRANNRIDAFRDARAALQMMERDLSSLVRTQWTPTTAPIPITRPAAYLVLKNLYADPGTVNAATDNQQVYALIAAKNAGSGDVCSVGYYCQWDATQHSYSLHRFFNPSENGNGTGTYSRFAQGSAAANNYASETDLYGPALVAPSGASDEVLASYVWNFRVTPYDAAGVAFTPQYSFVCDSSAATNNTPPAALEISFKAMSPQAARTLISVSNDPKDWMDFGRSRYKLLVAPNAYEFRTRIRF